MRRCKQNDKITPLMSLAQDGLLDAQGQQELDRHLATCATCRAEWEAMQRVDALFKQSEMVGPPLGFALRVERRLVAKEQRRQRWFRGLAALTGSLSLAGAAATALVLFLFGMIAWGRLGEVPAVQQHIGAVSHIAAGIGLVGKGASLFLGDLLLRYGPPLMMLLAFGLVVLAGTWLWLFIGRPGHHRHNGYA